MCFITHWRKSMCWDVIVCCCQQIKFYTSLRVLTFFCYKLAPSAVWRFEWVRLISLCKSLKTKHSLHNWIDFSSKFEIWGIYMSFTDLTADLGMDPYTRELSPLYRPLTPWPCTVCFTQSPGGRHTFITTSFSVMWTDGNKLHPDYQMWYTWKTPVLHFYLNIISKGKCDKLKHEADFSPKNFCCFAKCNIQAGRATAVLSAH